MTSKPDNLLPRSNGFLSNHQSSNCDDKKMEMEGQFEDAPDDDFEIPVVPSPLITCETNRKESTDHTASKPVFTDYTCAFEWKLSPRDSQPAKVSLLQRPSAQQEVDQEETQEEQSSYSDKFESDDETDGRTKAGSRTNEADICCNDVLCGRGGLTNHHAGNVFFRRLVRIKQEDYLHVSKRDKANIAFEIVEIVRALTPPGRFLRKDTRLDCWIEIGDKRAREKTSQALREGAPELREELTNPEEEHHRKRPKASSKSNPLVSKRRRTLSPIPEPCPVPDGSQSMPKQVTSCATGVNPLYVDMGRNLHSIPRDQHVGVIVQNPHTMAPTLVPTQMLLSNYGPANAAAYQTMVGGGGLPMMSVPQNAIMMQQQPTVVHMDRPGQVGDESQKTIVGMHPFFHHVPQGANHPRSVDPYFTMAMTNAQQQNTNFL